MGGIHKQVGEIKQQDEPITIHVIQVIQGILETQWIRSKDDHKNKKRIAEMGTWFMIDFCTGLRGEEMMLIELSGTRNSLTHLLRDNS